jgi:hypothetical protein
VNQPDRILDEMRHVVDNEHALTCDTARINDLMGQLESLAGKPDSLTDLIWTSLRIRHELTVVNPSDGWRECLSWIGTPPESPDVLGFEYMRSEQRLGRQSRWRTYYPWLTGRPVAAMPMLHNSAMASIAAWLLALKGLHADRPVTVVATRLYFETRQLAERLLAGSPVTLIECHTDEQFLDEMTRRRREPVIAWLDSAENADTLRLFETITDPAFSTNLLAVGWDNTLVPYWYDPIPAGRELTVPLVLIRSLHKLDQLGLEVASAGLLTFVVPRRVSARAAALFRGVSGDLMISTKVLGATAAPQAVRLLDALRLPERSLVEASNRAAGQAARRLAVRLRETVPEPYGVVDFPHACFVNIRCHGRDEKDIHAVIADVVAQASLERLPLERAASVGFNFTGMSVFTALEPGAEQKETFLRVAVGGHDDDMLDRVAACFATALTARRVA